MKRILPFILLILCLLLVSCKKSTPEPTQPPSPSPSNTVMPPQTPSPTPSLSPSPSEDTALSVEESYRRDAYNHPDGQPLCTLDVAIPEIVGRSGAAQAMAAYYQSVDAMLTSLWDEYVAEANDRYESAKTSGNLFMTVNIEGNFSVEAYTDRVLSVRRELYIYSGGVHGGTTITTDNFDLQTGRALTLMDFFTIEPNEIQQRLLPYVIAAIENNPGDYFENYETLALDLFPYDCYTVNEDTLTLIYPEYSLAAFTQGTLSFSIALADLRDVVNSDYIP